MGADKNSSRRRWKLQQDEHGFQHTSPTHYPSRPSPRSHWSATGPRNQHTTFRPENAAEHQTLSPLTNTGQTDEHHRSDRSLLVKLDDFHQVDPHRSGQCNTPVRPVTARKPPNHQTGQPTSKQTQTRNSPYTGQQQTHPNVHPSKNPPRVAPVRPVKRTGQTGVAWAARDEQHPRVNSPKSKSRSSESLHGLEQDFGDIMNTS
jgi:hypothetical protein